MLDWPFKLWGPKARHELTIEDYNELQSRLNGEKIVLGKEIEDLKGQLKARDQAYNEKSRQLESEVRKYLENIQLLQRQAEKHLNDSTKIRQLETEVARCCRENTVLRGNYEVLRQENKALQHAAKLNERKHLSDTEKNRRQHELLSQAEKQAEETEKAHREKLNELYNEINSLQIGPVQMNDEQISGIMRKLGHDLDSWVRLNFLYPQTEESGDRFPCNSLQLQAGIQADITHMIHSQMFVPYHFGLHDNSGGHFIEFLKGNIENTLSEKALRTWQTITCDLLEISQKDNREGLRRYIHNQVEKRFGQFSSTDDRSRQHQFQEFLQRCSELKTALSRQQARYLFHCSPVGTEFSLESMAFGGGDGGLGNTVRLSLWPGLAKQCHDGVVSLVEPELVWTTDSGLSDIS